MGYYLFLDDYRTLQKAYEATNDSIYIEKEWIIVRNYNEFISTINEMFTKKGNFPVLCSFDHDLHQEHIEYFFDNGGRENPPDPANANFTEKTGLDCAKWLVKFCIDNCLEIPKCKVHSKNPLGKKNILNYLDKHNGEKK